uniref:Uncharacterized protein n=1 Tax=Arundo donax TaxID=35708 RepID=A0A0A9DI18_ARUDO
MVPKDYHYQQCFICFVQTFFCSLNFFSKPLCSKFKYMYYNPRIARYCTLEAIQSENDRMYNVIKRLHQVQRKQYGILTHTHQTGK